MLIAYEGVNAVFTVLAAYSLHLHLLKETSNSDV